MSKLRLSIACWNYDRTRALREDRIPVDGIELTYLNLPVEETFFRMLRHHEFDVAEMSLSSYVMSLFAPEPPFVAIPIFPSRFFRHSCIYINRDRGIRARSEGTRRQSQDAATRSGRSPTYSIQEVGNATNRFPQLPTQCENRAYSLGR